LKQNPLFPDPAPKESVPIAHIDGGARGNPGPAAYGVVIRTPDGRKLAELGRYLGLQTNNFAEYSGLIAALEYAKKQNLPGLKVFSDSELLVKQMRGEYKVKHPGLKTLYARARDLAQQLAYFSIQHVLRSSNRDADRLVNQVLDAEEREYKG
jgi:ribonuclease HI